MGIRRLQDEDLPQLLELYAFLHKGAAPLDSEKLHSLWEEILSDPTYVYLGFFNECSLISSCNLAVIKNLTYQGLPYGVVENVVTHPGYRNRGYGTKLLNAICETAWDLSCYKVMLLTSRRDKATLTFYESAGFDPNNKQGYVIYRSKQGVNP